MQAARSAKKLPAAEQADRLSAVMYEKVELKAEIGRLRRVLQEIEAFTSGDAPHADACGHVHGLARAALAEPAVAEVE